MQKIILANHIRHTADLLQADAIQQLEVALLGSLAVQVVDLLSGEFVQAKASTSVTPAQPHPRIYTSTPPAPPPFSVLVVGILTTSPTPAVVPQWNHHLVFRNQVC